MKRFHQSHVVVIGASAGIGYFCARYFSEEGAHVLLVARREEILKTIQQELPNSTYLVADISKREDCQKIVSYAQAQWERIDIVVNNAALHHRGAVRTRTAEELADMVRTNLEAPIYLSRLFLDSLIHSKGVLINVASLAGCIPLANSSTYSGSKFGLRAFSLALAQEVKELGVGVCLVSPGPVATSFILDDLDRVSDITLSQPISSPEDVAKAILGCAIHRRPETKIPKFSGFLSTLGYLFPVLRRLLLPLLQKKGAKAKEQLRRTHQK